MPNEFYSQYQEIKERVIANPDNFFKRREIMVNNVPFHVYEFDFDEQIYDHAYQIADKKRHYVNKLSPAGHLRTEKEIFISCFRGVLAEIGAQLYLELTLVKSPGVKVERWDLERTYWENSASEYDVRVILPNNFVINCESRSSMSYITTLSEFCSKNHVMGSYTTKVKLKEKDNHLYFRPVYQYDDSIIEANKLKLKELNKEALSNPNTIKKYNGSTSEIKKDVKADFSKKLFTSFIEDINNKKIHLYYVSGATLQDIILHKEQTTNAQEGAKYNQVRITQCGDVISFHKKVCETIVNEAFKTI